MSILISPSQIHFTIMLPAEDGGALPEFKDGNNAPIKASSIVSFHSMRIPEDKGLNKIWGICLHLNSGNIIKWVYDEQELYQQDIDTLGRMKNSNGGLMFIEPPVASHTMRKILKDPLETLFKALHKPSGAIVEERVIEDTFYNAHVNSAYIEGIELLCAPDKNNFKGIEFFLPGHNITWGFDSNKQAEDVFKSLNLTYVTSLVKVSHV